MITEFVGNYARGSVYTGEVSFFYSGEIGWQFNRVSSNVTTPWIHLCHRVGSLQRGGHKPSQPVAGNYAPVICLASALYSKRLECYGNS